MMIPLSPTLATLTEAQWTALLARDHDISAAYGISPSADTEALHQSAAAFSLDRRGLVRVRGRHWQRFLHSMLTADIKALSAGQTSAACLVNANGGYIADFGALITHSGCLLDIPAGVTTLTVETLRKYVLALDVKLEDARDEWRLLSIQGPAAAEAVRAALELQSPLPTAPFGAEQFSTAHGLGFVVHRSRTGQPGFDVWLPKESEAEIESALSGCGVKPAGAVALEAARIEAGLPAPPVDLDDRIIAFEAPLRHGISLSKGCYTGQEALAKMAHRGEPRRVLLGLHWSEPPESLPAPGSLVWCSGKEVGWTASATYSPRLGGAVALTWIKRRAAVLAPTDASVGATPDEGPAARLLPLPLAWGNTPSFPVPNF